MREIYSKTLTQRYHLVDHLPQSLGLSHLSPLFISSSESQRVVKDFGLRPEHYICLIPSASFPEKRWPKEKFFDLLTQLLSHDLFRDYDIVILAGPEDHFCDYFRSITHRVFHLQGKTTFIQSAHILRWSCFSIGNDTGLPHMSEAMGRPVIVLLGPTGEEFGFIPHLEDSSYLSTPLWCHPCSPNGKGFCIRSRRWCLEKITVQHVMDQAVKLENRLRQRKGDYAQHL
jgi:ADP-heptose:LPS heptosyltransferase